MTKKIILSCVLSLVFGSQLFAQDKNITPENTEKSTSVAIFPAKPVLYFVDGVQLKPTLSSMFGGNPLSAMNPNDIESIEVLKGKDTVTRYGAEADCPLRIVVLSISLGFN